ncbi:hypothetical protein LPB19_12545 [Marinobacter salinisoli]|uniref:Uncharacterized protein n=1 Tax=Marinobacter salinisoli TaxID=2769486 RepID=A0ABX7MP01_9GAMM|nr:hypothetical protein [Marinobacter salinisoli]QSP94017.1 hypothetical protein LPB19_12545 [Marinobacter salinisoli]
MKDIKIGDWVTSYTAGIWQVYRVIDDFYELRWSLQEEKKKSDRTLICSKRLFNSKWKRSFSSESCHHVFVDLLSSDDVRRISVEFNKNPKLQEAFEKYEPKDSNLLSDIGFSLPESYDYDDFAKEVESLLAGRIAHGLIMDEILEILEGSDVFQYKGKYPQNARIQFFCQNYEISSSELIFRRYRTLNF